MNDHIRTNTRTLDMICTHCGAVQPMTPGPVLDVLSKLETFKQEHASCPVPVFKPGDRVSFCGEEATVVSNYGSEGMVDLGGGQLCRWYWVFQGERVTPVKGVTQ